MIITKFEERQDWLNARKTRITGSRLKDIIVKRGAGEKKGYYELIAERVAQEVDPEFIDYVPTETPMDRGTRLEKYAIAEFSRVTSKKVDTSLVLWAREDNESIAISPDGPVLPPDGSKTTEVVEAKCLSSASHLEVYLTNEIPSEYREQGLQYFVVNDDIETVHFVFYDPRIVVKDYFVIDIHRSEVEDEIAFLLDTQKQKLAKIDQVVAELTGF